MWTAVLLLALIAPQDERLEQAREHLAAGRPHRAVEPNFLELARRDALHNLEKLAAGDHTWP